MPALTNIACPEASNSRTLEPDEQTWRVLGKQALQLIYTALLLTSTIMSLKVYEQANTVGHKGKMSLNVVVIIVNPAFSLNCFVSSMLELVKRTRSNGDRISGRI